MIRCGGEISAIYNLSGTNSYSYNVPTGFRKHVSAKDCRYPIAETVTLGISLKDSLHRKVIRKTPSTPLIDSQSRPSRRESVFRVKVSGQPTLDSAR
jgi:hypothetical protein